MARSAARWLEPGPFVGSEPLTSRAPFKRHGRDIRLEDDSVIVAGRDAAVSLEDVPAIFVGYGINDAGVVNADVRGKLAIMLYGNAPFGAKPPGYRERRSEEHTSELQSLMRISYAVFCLKKKNI